MNNRPSSPTTTASQESLSDPHRQGLWIVFARSTWFTLAVLPLGAFFATLPERLARLRTLCTGPTCSKQQLAPEQAKLLISMGWSLEVYAGATDRAHLGLGGTQLAGWRAHRLAPAG